MPTFCLCTYSIYVSRRLIHECVGSCTSCTKFSSCIYHTRQDQLNKKWEGDEETRTLFWRKKFFSLFLHLRMFFLYLRVSLRIKIENYNTPKNWINSLICTTHYTVLKGSVSRDFRPPVFLMIRIHLEFWQPFFCLFKTLFSKLQRKQYYTVLYIVNPPLKLLYYKCTILLRQTLPSP